MARIGTRAKMSSSLNGNCLGFKSVIRMECIGTVDISDPAAWFRSLCHTRKAGALLLLFGCGDLVRFGDWDVRLVIARQH